MVVRAALLHGCPFEAGEQLPECVLVLFGGCRHGRLSARLAPHAEAFGRGVGGHRGPLHGPRARSLHRPLRHVRRRRAAPGPDRPPSGRHRAVAALLQGESEWDLVLAAPRLGPRRLPPRGGHYGSWPPRLPAVCDPLQRLLPTRVRRLPSREGQGCAEAAGGQAPWHRHFEIPRGLGDAVQRQRVQVGSVQEVDLRLIRLNLKLTAEPADQGPALFSTLADANALDPFFP
mmetsp:Transcript_146000/g.468173  ORF Transcript_146000/g.468173 Transcript_146000/m.468173 type:complete len:231 (+) Transcript_146000:588-1280(+)